MAEQITINAVLNDKVSGPAATMAGNVSKSMKSVETSSAKSTKSLAAMAKGFLSFEVAMRAVRGLATAVKEFERVSGGTVLKTLTSQFGQLQMEIASAMMPALQSFSDWWNKNAPQILTVARFITNAVINAFSLMGNAIKLVADTIALAIETMVTAITASITVLIEILNVVLFGALNKTVKNLNDFGRLSAAAMKKTAKDIGKDAIGIGESISNMFTFDATKGSGVTFISKEMQDAAKKAQEERKKALEEQIKENLEANNKLIDSQKAMVMEAAKITQSAGQFKITQLKAQHEKELAEIDDYIFKVQSKYIDKGLPVPATVSKTISTKTQERGNVVARQSMEMTSMTGDVAKEARDSERARWEAANDELTKGIEKYKESLLTLSDLQHQLAQQQTEYFTGMVGSIAQAQATVAGAIMSIAQYQMDLIDKTAEKQKAEATATVKGKRTLQRELDRIDADAAKKRAKYRKMELVGSLVSSIANTAEGITKAIAQGGILGLITGIAVGIAGAIQVGIITSQLSKVDQGMAYGGVVQGQMSGDKSVVKANAGEVILNTTQQRRLLALANGGGNGGGIQIHETINVGGNLDMDAAERIRNDREKQLVKLKEDIKELSWRGQLQMAAA